MADAEGPPPDARPRFGAVAALGLVVAAGLFTWLTWRFAWLCDDAFISFRYGQHWAQGAGLRFNPGTGTPVEGYSNFLWVALGALVELVGGEQTTWMPVLSWLAGLATLVLLAVALRRWVGAGQWTTAWTLVTLGASVPFATWGTSGLETMLFTFLFLAMFALLVLHRGGVPVAAAGLAGLALALVRVEGTFWAAGLCALGWLARRARGEREGWAVVGTLAIVAAGAWAWWIARYLYYGDPWPNTVYVKVGFSREVLAIGARYVAVFALTWWTPAVVLLAVPSALARERRTRLLPALACWAALVGYAVLVGGDFMAMGRLLVPSLPFQALLFAGLLDALTRRRATGWLAPPLALAHVALGALAGFGVDLVPRTTLERLHFRGNSEEFRTELEQWHYMRDATAERTALARLLAEATQPGETLVRGAIGVLGYYTQLVVLDTFGLVSPEVSHRAEVSEDRSPGHWKKVEVEFFLDQEPTYLVARSFPVPEGPEAAEARRELKRQVRRLAKRWEQDYASVGYAAVLTRYPAQAGEGAGEQLLVLVRRFGDQGEVERAWARFDAALDELG